MVRRDSRVETLVSDQSTRQGEPFVTERALVGSLSSVSPLVIPQLSCRVTALITVRTGELLSRKASHDLRVHRLQVRFQVPVAREALQADGAVVRSLSSVCPPVQPELPLAGKSFVTESAWKRFLSSVDPFMDQKKPLLWESLLTHRARKGSLARVCA